MDRIRVGAVVAIVLLAATVTEAAEPLRRLTLEEAVTLALRENAALRAKSFEYQATRAGEITAALRPNPTGTFLAEQFGAQGGEQYTAAVSQTIETGGKRTRRIESAQAATRVALFDLADVRRTTVFQVKKSFNDVLVARAALDLAQQNLKTLDELERIQRFREERGDISQLELLRIQVQRYQFEKDAADARQALQSARVSLRAVTGPELVAEDFDVVGELAFKDVQFTPNQLYGLTMQNRPDVLSAQAAADKARADIRLARANAWWDFAPQLEYQRIGPDNTIGFGVSLPIRIFDRNQGEIARTRADAERADAHRQATAIQALTEVDTALAALRTASDKVKALRDTYLPKAARVRDTVEFAYRRGGLSLLDFLDAERSYRETSLAYYQSLGDFWTAYYQLESAVGGSLEP